MGLDAADAVATTSSQTRKRARSLSRGDGEGGEESAAKRARSRSTSRIDLSLHDDKVCFLFFFGCLLLLFFDLIGSLTPKFFDVFRGRQLC